MIKINYFLSAAEHFICEIPLLAMRSFIGLFIRL